MHLDADAVDQIHPGRLGEAMRRAIWPAFLGCLLVAAWGLHIWDVTNLAFWGLAAIRAQISEEILKPPAAPTWAEPNAVGYPIKDIPIEKDSGIMALGVNNAGDYAPLIMQDEGAVRAAGKNVQTGPEWVAIRVDKEGRIICSPESFQGMVERLLKPGERIVIERAP